MTDTPKRLTAEQLAECLAIYPATDIRGMASLRLSALTLERDAVTRELTTAVLRAENWHFQAAAVSLERDAAYDKGWQDGRDDSWKAYETALAALTLERDKAVKALNSIQAVADEQAEDESLWSVPLFRLLSISEAYLQQGLRKLHYAIEDALKELKETKEQK